MALTGCPILRALCEGWETMHVGFWVAQRFSAAIK